MDLGKIRVCQEVLASSYYFQNFNVYITNDEDKGLHICDCSIFIHNEDINDKDYLERLKNDGYKVINIDGYNFWCDDEMEVLLRSDFIKFSPKRETFYIPTDWLYDTRDDV